MRIPITFHAEDDFTIKRNWEHVPRRGDKLALDIAEGDKITELKDFRVMDVVWKHDMPGKKKVSVEIELEGIK